MKTDLVLYETAITAIAAARSVDEVKHYHSVAMAMKLYAMQANDRRMEADALEIRMRAALRLGEMMQSQKETVGLAEGSRRQIENILTGGVSDTPPVTDNAIPSGAEIATLAEAGIDKNLAKEARAAFRLYKADKFEDKVKEERERIINRSSKRPKSIETIRTGAKILKAFSHFHSIMALIEEDPNEFDEESLNGLKEEAQGFISFIDKVMQHQLTPRATKLTVVKG